MEVSVILPTSLLARPEKDSATGDNVKALTVVSDNPVVYDHLLRRCGRQRQAVPQGFRTRGVQAALKVWVERWTTSVDAATMDRVMNDIEHAIERAKTAVHEKYLGYLASATG